MPQLRSLSLHLLSTANHIALDLTPPPPPGGSIVLPVLTRLNFRGIAEYLEGLVARIDAPRLGDIEVTLFNKFIFDPSKLSKFIDRIEMQKPYLRADILSSERSISTSFTRPEDPVRLELQVSCEPLARQLSYMAQICNSLSPLLLSVEHLRISATQPSRRQDNRDREGWAASEWQTLIDSFRGAKWVHVAGDHSTNIMCVLQLPHMLLPALHRLYIPQPGPRHAPLREAVVSLMTSRRLSGHPIAVEYGLCHVSELRGTGPFSQQATIEMLSDDVLLNIFRQYLDASPRCWPELAHVCRGWRQIVFSPHLSPRLRLHCTYGTSVLKNLDCWPPLPLVVNYESLHIVPKDEDNIMAALEKSGRVCSISLAVSSSLLKKLSTISEPFLQLEELVLLSQDNLQLTLPSTFWWGHRLRTLHSTGIAFPSLPQLLLPSQDLVDLQLHEIPAIGYFSPEAFANALCGMTQLQTLSLHFLSLPPRRNYLGLPPPPRPTDRVFLPVLTRFKYRGISKYLDSLVARIDAPCLKDIDITFFSQPTLDAAQLGLFINRIETRSSPLRADIISSGGTISIIFTQPGALTRFRLRIPCEQLDWQLSSISQICDHFYSFLFSVEDLGIETIGPSSMPDDMDDKHWLRLIHSFDGAKDFRVVGELAADILRALRPANKGHKPVLPTLRNLHVRGPTSVQVPLRVSVISFVAQRQLSGHPVRVHAGGFGEARDVWWVGNFAWQGTDPTRDDKKEVWARVVAFAPSGKPLASTWPKALALMPTGPAVPMNELQEWMKKTQPVLMRVQAAPGTDDHNFRQLIKLLRERNCLRDGRFKAWADSR
ncbi:hypothetical protein BJY52DRAFT_720687 [Lactarius psammicola]|nr:hypothetical protein BJY52DRAFT_720687 [Lactarius psammicola]